MTQIPGVGGHTLLPGLAGHPAMPKCSSQLFRLQSFEGQNYLGWSGTGSLQGVCSSSVMGGALPSQAELGSWSFCSKSMAGCVHFWGLQMVGSWGCEIISREQEVLEYMVYVEAGEN